MAKSTPLPNISCHDVARFRSKVRTADDDGCWEWTGHRGGYKNRYGSFYIGGRTCYAHRVAFQIAYGPFLHIFQICHSCDNPTCVRPDHLFLGAGMDNMVDARRKGRPVGVHSGPSPLLRGTRNGMARLTESDVREIRRRYAAGEGQPSIAGDFGVSRPHISGIVRGRFWGWLDG